MSGDSIIPEPEYDDDFDDVAEANPDSDMFEEELIPDFPRNTTTRIERPDFPDNERLSEG